MFKWLIFAIMALSPFLYADSSPGQVNYHLRRMQALIENREAQAQLNAKVAERSQFETQEQLLQNDPSFGLGDEKRPRGTTDANRLPSEDLLIYMPRKLTAEERIRLEVEEHNILRAGEEVKAQNENYSDKEEQKRFIQEFKRKAAAKGVKIEVDPVTFTAREVPSR